MIRKTIFIPLLVLFLALGAMAQDNHMVPMSDGTQLMTVVYKPAEGKGPWPVMLERTPYPRPPKGARWTDQGIVYVIQSVRGRFGSEGEFRPFADEGWGEHQDGADTVRWILAQPWCNGKLGTYGGSATAIASGLLSPATSSLTCQILQDGSTDFPDNLTYQGGVFRKSLVEVWLAMGVQSPEYADVWRAQAPESDYWLNYDANARVESITSPALHVSGWWDIFANSTVEHFMQRQARGGVGAKGNQKLLMRPAAHGPWNVQSLKFPKNYDEFRVTPYRNRFAQYWLAGEENGIMDEPAVHYYTIGDDTSPEGPGWEWRTADTWPPFPTEETAYYLSDDGTLSADASALKASHMTYAFDPEDPVPTTGGQNLALPYGPYDQRPISTRSDVLAFATPPLDEPLETTGHFAVRLHVSSDAPDTDFTAALVDIYPAGDDREILMLDNIRRVKYRLGNRKPAPPLKDGEVVLVEIDLGHISWIFNTGHRIGLHVSSSNHPRFEVNPNNGQPLPSPDHPSRVAQNTVHMGPEYPSAVLLPIRKQ
ncbi:MAG: CocE/NonD family hydrolase [Nitrospiraceae bacterium]|nr:CocE/NonD family hydrolase [Nitrospiraceae bacterium]